MKSLFPSTILLCWIFFPFIHGVVHQTKASASSRIEAMTAYQSNLPKTRQYHPHHPSCMKIWQENQPNEAIKKVQAFLEVSNKKSSNSTNSRVKTDCSVDSPLLIVGNEKTMPHWIAHFPHFGEVISLYYSFVLWYVKLYQAEGCLQYNYIIIPQHLTQIWEIFGKMGSGEWIPEMLSTINAIFQHVIIRSDSFEAEEEQKGKNLIPRKIHLEGVAQLNFLHPSDALLLTSDILQQDPCQYYNQSKGILQKKVRLILINRKGNRQILNAENVTSHLQQWSPSLGGYSTEIVFLEGMNFQQQVQLFSETDIVIAIHGAALANVYFMKPCSALVMDNPWIFQNWGTLSRFASSAQVSLYEWMEEPETTLRFPDEDQKNGDCHKLMKTYLEEWNSPEKGPQYKELNNKGDIYSPESLSQKCTQNLQCSICARQIQGLIMNLAKLETKLTQAIKDRQECIRSHPFYNPR